MKFPGMESQESIAPIWGGTIRPLAARDLDAVAALEALCNPQPWSREALKAFVQELSAGSTGGKPGSRAQSIALVAEQEGRIVGYVFASCVADEGEVLILGVHPDARRMGTARALLTALLARLGEARATSVFLEVRRGNKAAIALYTAFGFGEAGVRKGYYADTGEDALLLHVFLKRERT
jgi:[ribosomal protein S18]-alanine N-acetyltransferase